MRTRKKNILVIFDPTFSCSPRPQQGYQQPECFVSRDHIGFRPELALARDSFSRASVVAPRRMPRWVCLSAPLHPLPHASSYPASRLHRHLTPCGDFSLPPQVLALSLPPRTPLGESCLLPGGVDALLLLRTPAGGSFLRHVAVGELPCYWIPLGVSCLLAVGECAGPLLSLLGEFFWAAWEKLPHSPCRHPSSLWGPACAMVVWGGPVDSVSGILSAAFSPPVAGAFNISWATSSHTSLILLGPAFVLP